jgi:hypothetical protein
VDVAGTLVRSAVTVVAAPHSLQKRFPAGFSLPQAVQHHGNGDPQSPQNFEAVPTLAPHRGQFMRSPSRMLASPFARHGAERATKTQKPTVKQWSLGRKI